MNSLLLTAAGFVIAILTLAFAVPHFIDWNSYRHVFEAQASKIVGRHIYVGGDVRLRLLPTPLLRFSEVRISDSKGQIDIPFAQAKSFTVWLAASPLLSGILVAREIEIERLVINLRLGADGAANWRDMGPREGELTFAPREIELDSVKLTDATIAIFHNPTASPIKVENLSGELSARSLYGPYNFTGHFRYADLQREIKFSTGRRQKNGRLRLKSVVRDAAGAQTIGLDGVLTSFAEHPRFEGRLTARYGGGDGRLSQFTGGVGVAAQARVEIRSRLSAGLNEALLDDIEVTIRRDEKPQILRGRLALSWSDDLDIEGQIASQWFDLDALAAGKDGEKEDLNGTLEGLVELALEHAGRAQHATLQVAIDKAGLAGDVVSDINARLIWNGSQIAIDGLSLTLPGANQVDLAGTLRLSADSAEYAGSVSLEGSSLGHLLAWSGLEKKGLISANGTRFSIDAAVEAGGKRLSLENAKGKLSGSAYSGKLYYSWDERPIFALELTSKRLDFTTLFGRNAIIPALLKLAGGREEEAGSKSRAARESGAPNWLGLGDVRVDLQVASAVLPGLDHANLAVKFSLTGGDLNIQRLNLRSPEGLIVRAEGRLTDLDGRPEGRIMLTADAAKRQGIEAFWSILDLPGLVAVAPRIDRLAPMRIALAIESEPDRERGLEARLGGAFDTSNIAILARYKGDLSAIDKGRFDLEGTIGNDDGAGLIRQIFPNISTANLEPFHGRRGLVTLKADGEARALTQMLVRLEVGNFRWEIAGKAKDSSRGFKFDGRTTLQSQGVAPVLALAGLDLGLTVENKPQAKKGPRLWAENKQVVLKTALKSTGPVYRLTELSGSIGKTELKGVLTIDCSEEVPAIEARIEADDVSLAALLRPLLAWQTRTVPRATHRTRRLIQRRAQASRAASRWAERSFNTDLLSSHKAHIAVTTKRLQLAGAFVLRDAELNAVLGDGRLDISQFTGKWAGGKARISAQLVGRSKGLELTGKALIKRAKLDRVTALGGNAPLVRGTADLKLALNGVGLTPKGLANALSG